MAHYEADCSYGYATHPYYTHSYYAPSLPNYAPRRHHAPSYDPRLRIDEHLDTPEEVEELRAFIRTIRKRKRPVVRDDLREALDDIREVVRKALDGEREMLMTDCRVQIEKLPVVDTGQSKLKAMRSE